MIMHILIYCFLAGTMLVVYFFTKKKFRFAKFMITGVVGLTIIFFVWMAFMLFIVGPFMKNWENGKMEKITKSEEGIFQIPLFLSASLEPQRANLETHLINAQKRLRDFAVCHNWEEHTNENFIDRAEIFDNQQDFINALLNLLEIDEETELPKTISASLENRVFMSISPELYATIYPEGIEEHSFEKLITHEIAHRLHVRILNGDEEKMGPIWFFEGFALYAAGQFIHDKVDMSAIWDVVNSTTRGSYKEYAGVFRYFAEKIPLPELIEQAGKENFGEWLANP
jgi:hypothetical protein